MKKIIFLTALILFTTSTLGFAQQRRDKVWINIGYSYLLPESKSMKAPTGPVNFTVGGEPVKWFAIDFSLGYTWDMKIKNGEYNNPYIDEVSTFNGRLNFLFQPSFDVQYFILRPYIGGGAVININSTNEASYIFTPGFSVKAGFRFTENGLLFGIGAEYIFNQFSRNNEFRDASGYLFGGEIGLMF